MMVHKDSPRRWLPVALVVLAAFFSVFLVFGPRIAYAEDEVSERKTALPALIKEVYEDRDEAWGQIADTGDDRALHFRLRALMPDVVADLDVFTLTFVDTWDQTIVVDEWSLAVTVDGEEVSDYAYLIVDRELKLTIDNVHELHEAPITADSVVEVSYEAHLNRSLVATGFDKPIINTAHLEYSTNQDGTGHGQTEEVSNSVYTWQVTLIKNGSGKPQEGVAFTLQNLETSLFLQPDNVWGEEPVELFTDKNGKIVVPRIDSGTYELTETAAFDSYVKLPDPIVFVVEANLSQKELEVTLDAPEKFVTLQLVDGNAGLIEIAITNAMYTILPSSGGMGVYILYALGIVLILAGTAIGFTTLRRKKQSE